MIRINVDEMYRISVKESFVVWAARIVVADICSGSNSYFSCTLQEGCNEVESSVKWLRYKIVDGDWFEKRHIVDITW